MKRILTALIITAMIMAMLPTIGVLAAETSVGGYCTPQEASLTLQSGVTSELMDITTEGNGATFTLKPQTAVWSNYSLNGYNTYDGLSGIQWKNLGTAELTYDIKYEGTLNRENFPKNYEEFRAGLTIRVPGSTEDHSRLLDPAGNFHIYRYTDTEQNGITKNVKTVVTFGDDKTLVDFYVKDQNADEYTFVEQKESNVSVPADKRKITGVVPFFYAGVFSDNNSLKVTISNVKVKEYASSALVIAPSDCGKDKKAEISYNVPNGAIKATLQVGGKTVETISSPGAYKTNVDLSTGWWGNVPVTLNATMADGSKQSDTKTIKVTNGAAKETLGTEDFEDDNVLYTINPDQGKIIDGSDKGRSKILSTPNYQTNKATNVIYVENLNYPEGYLCDVEFDYYQTTNDAWLYFAINSDVADGSYNPVYGGKVQNDSGKQLSHNEWHTMKITVDSANNRWDVDVDNGTYTGSHTVNINGIQSVKLGAWGYASPYMYLDNVKFTFYNNESAPGVEAVSVDSATNKAQIKFDSALKKSMADTDVTLKAGSANVDANVVYDAQANTLTVTPSAEINSESGEIVISKDCFGTQEDMVIPVLFTIDKYELTRVSGGFIADVMFRSALEQSAGKVYVAIYKDSSLQKVIPISLAANGSFQTAYERIAADDQSSAAMFVWSTALSPILEQPVRINN